MSIEFTHLDQLERRIQRLEDRMDQLTESVQESSFYSVAQFAEIVHRSRYSVREWCRNGRIQATRRAGRGPYREYVISHAELMHYWEFGLRPVRGSHLS